MSDVLIKLGALAGAARFRRISEKLYIDGNDAYKKLGVPFKATWFPVYYALINAEKPLTTWLFFEKEYKIPVEFFVFFEWYPWNHDGT